MKKVLFWVMIPFAAAGSLAGCYYDVEEELYGGVACNTPAVVTYVDQVKAIVDAKCATSNCHSTSGGQSPDFSVAANVISGGQDGSIEARVITEGNMPPSSSAQLSACELEMIQAWISQGAN
ncbi:MAG: hypothetical protein RL220_1005 [Bacteroidota bacterium]